MQLLRDLERNLEGILVAVGIGVLAVFLWLVLDQPILDPLVVAMTLGILVRSFVTFPARYLYGFKLAPRLFIPIGVVLYGAVNLKLGGFEGLSWHFFVTVFSVLLAYLISALMFSKWIGLHEKERYLVAVGSAICGASAITITSRAIEAESDEVSVSLIAVYLTALIGFFVIFPTLLMFVDISPLTEGVFYGAVVQITGFVKAATRDLPVEIQQIAISVKAVRYLALLFLIPLFSSLVMGRFHVPWYIWGFLVAGAFFSYNSELAGVVRPVLGAIQTVFWSVAMAAIGLNANLASLFTKNGLKALAVSMVSFGAALLTFMATCVLLDLCQA